MNNAKGDTYRRCNIIILSSTVVFILVLVIVGLCVRFLTEGQTQRIVLIVLICVLIAVGASSVIFLEIRRRKASNITYNNRRMYVLTPTAPPLSNPPSVAGAKNYSNRTTLQAPS